MYIPRNINTACSFDMLLEDESLIASNYNKMFPDTPCNFSARKQRQKGPGTG